MQALGGVCESHMEYASFDRLREVPSFSSLLFPESVGLMGLFLSFVDKDFGFRASGFGRFGCQIDCGR